MIRNKVQLGTNMSLVYPLGCISVSQEGGGCSSCWKNNNIDGTLCKPVISSLVLNLLQVALSHVTCKSLPSCTPPRRMYRMYNRGHLFSGNGVRHSSSFSLRLPKMAATYPSTHQYTILCRRKSEWHTGRASITKLK